MYIVKYNIAWFQRAMSKDQPWLVLLILQFNVIPITVCEVEAIEAMVTSENWWFLAAMVNCSMMDYCKEWCLGIGDEFKPYYAISKETLSTNQYTLVPHLKDFWENTMDWWTLGSRILTFLLTIGGYRI